MLLLLLLRCLCTVWIQYLLLADRFEEQTGRSLFLVFSFPTGSVLRQRRFVVQLPPPRLALDPKLKDDPTERDEIVQRHEGRHFYVSTITRGGGGNTDTVED